MNTGWNNPCTKMILACLVIFGFLSGCVQNNQRATPDPMIIIQIDDLINGYTEDGEFSGSVLIAEKGSILINQGYGFADFEHKIPNTPQTQFSMGSVTKLFTCAAIRIAADRGLLSQDDTLADYIPDYPRGDEITVTHLLSHSSGIPDIFNDLWYADPFETQDPITIEALIDRFKFESLEFDPGTQSEYSNSGFILLAYILQQATGITYYDFIETEIFSSLKMTDSIADWDSGFSNKALGYYNPQGVDPPSRHPDVHHTQIVGTGNLYSTVEDFYRWYQAIHDDESWRRYDCGPHYGRGFGYKSVFIPIHSLDLMIVMLSNFIDAPLEQMVLEIEELLLEDDLIELDREELDSYTGEFHAQFPDGRETRIFITRVSGYLTVNDPGSKVFGFFSLYPISTDQFIMKRGHGYAGQVEFHKDEDGNLMLMILNDEEFIELTVVE